MMVTVHENKTMTPEQALESALQQVRSGTVNVDQVLILMRNNNPEKPAGYEVGWVASTMRIPDILALLNRANYSLNKLFG